MSEDDITVKQNYLREEVIEKGLDPNEFIGYLQSNRGLIYLNSYRKWR